MSHFKANSRFGSLNEEIKEKSNKKENNKIENNKIENNKIENNKRREHNNSKEDKNHFEQPNRSNFRQVDGFKKDYNDRRDNNSLSYRQRRLMESALQEEQDIKNEQKRAQEEKDSALNPENFPELISVTSIKPTCNSGIPSFLEKVKTEKVSDTTSSQNPFDCIKPGWTIIQMNKENNRIVQKEKRIPFEEEKNTFSESETSYYVLDALVNLHETRKQKYIEDWGEDEYEKMFLFPNYDYHYFDKLDEKRNEEMRKYYNIEDEEDDYDSSYEY
jgi:hypothetical protein